MEQKFHEALREARKSSRYPLLSDFARKADLLSRTTRKYESGEALPPIKVLNEIIDRCGMAEHEAQKLRELHAIEVARRLGVTFRRIPNTLNVSDLAIRIQREIEYELKREQIFVTKKTNNACVRRIEMLLKDALRLP